MLQLKLITGIRNQRSHMYCCFKHKSAAAQSLEIFFSTKWISPWQTTSNCQHNRWITALFTCRLRTFPLKCFVSNKTHFSSLAKMPDARLAFSFSPRTFLSDWSPSWCLVRKHSQPHMNMSHTEDNQASLFLISCPYACHGSSFKLFFFYFFPTQGRHSCICQRLGWTCI